MGAHSGNSDRCLFTKQAAQKLVCIISKAAAYTDRSSRTSPCSSEPDLLGEPLSVAARTAGKRGRELESSNALTYSKRKLAKPTLVNKILRLGVREDRRSG